MLRIHQLSVDYRSLGGQTSCALAGVSLTIAEGEIVGLLGESGSGKSTLGLALCNALPDSVVSVRGAIRWEVESSSLAKSAQEDVAAATHAALIPQSPSLTFSPYLRCGSQVEDVLHSRGVDPHQAALQTQQLLAEAGLPLARDAIRAYPHELSGGELQRVAIARALASRPRLLVADEATSALDLLHAIRLQHTLREISRARGLAILWITHDPRELPDFAHRVALLEQGCLVEEMTGAAFARGDVGAHTRRYLDAIPATWTADGAVSTHAAGSDVSALRRQDPAP